MSTNNNPAPDDSARWEFALKLSESNNEQIGKLTEKLDALIEDHKARDKQFERFRRTMNAALIAYLADEEGGKPE